MNPAGAHADASLALAALWALDGVDGGEMSTRTLRHVQPPPALLLVQHLMNERDGERSLAHSRGHPLDVADGGDSLSGAATLLDEEFPLQHGGRHPSSPPYLVNDVVRSRPVHS